MEGIFGIAGSECESLEVANMALLLEADMVFSGQWIFYSFDLFELMSSGKLCLKCEVHEIEDWFLSKGLILRLGDDLNESQGTSAESGWNKDIYSVDSLKL